MPCPLLPRLLLPRPPLPFCFPPSLFPLYFSIFFLLLVLSRLPLSLSLYKSLPHPLFCRLFDLPSLIFCLLTCPFLFPSPSLPRDRPHTLVLPLSWPLLRSPCFHKAAPLVVEVICTCGTPWSSRLNPTDRNVCSSWASGLILNAGMGRLGTGVRAGICRTPG